MKILFLDLELRVLWSSWPFLYEIKIHEVIRIPDGSSIQVLSEPQYHEKLLPCLIFEFEN